MDSITFSMPTLATSAMSSAEQISVTANQAAAAIVCCYLDHMNTAINKGLTGATVASGVSTNSSSIGFISQFELVSLINDVQAALRTV